MGDQYIDWLERTTESDGNKLKNILSVAQIAMNELQGRLVDEGHRKAFTALEAIIKIAMEK